MTSKAFCPGHVTAVFFAPEAGPTPEATGSRGVGFCITLGCTAKVRTARSSSTTLVPKGDTRISPVVASALMDYLMESPRPVALQLELSLDLPVGQGFGMSGAMAMASVMAAEGEMGLLGGDRAALAALAHRAEVEFRTGLGDVVAQLGGGIDHRIAPGLPPHGEVARRDSDARVLVSWSRRPLHTWSVLADPAAWERLRVAALHRLEGLGEVPGMDWLLEEGWAFSREAGLAGPEVERMVELCSSHGRASQVMLGNSVFAVGDLEAMAGTLSAEGFPSRTVSVDNGGARVLRR